MEGDLDVFLVTLSSDDACGSDRSGHASLCDSAAGRGVCPAVAAGDDPLSSFSLWLVVHASTFLQGGSASA